jgi:WD40 repeat protein/uncharacterized protein YjbI with pentapeptide repeats
MPPPRPASSHPHVSTFYSFKGGVGRSLLLANVGWILAERRRVVLWDLDVEAPGLHLIPALRPPEVKRGFFEWLGEWRGAQAFQAKGQLQPRDARTLERLVLPVPARPNLSILPAFGDGADFARLYGEGPWRRFLVEEPALGLALFDALVEVLGRGREHILIDSRTGITDLGGFLAALLPHTTVLVGGYGHQSLHGLLQVRRALEPAVEGRLPPRQRLGGGTGLHLVHVVSPVPEDAADSAERRRIVGEVLGAVRPIEIPFDRRLLWSERLLAAEDPEGATASAYGRVAERLSGLRDDLLVSVEAVASEAARDPAPEPRRGELSSRRGWSFEERVRRLLELHGYTVEPEQLLGGHAVDLVARRTGGLDEECWWVECKDHRQPVRKEVLEKLVAWVGGKVGHQNNAKAMVVGRSFSEAAITFAKDRQDVLRVWTVEDLERRLFDPRPYLHNLVTGFEQSALSRTYVAQRVLLEGRPDVEEPVDLLSHALAWAEGDGTRLWLLLGDYGTGKTAFFQRFSAELARRALADPEAPFPIAIDLKLVPNATSAETLLFEHLRQRAPAFRGDPAALLHLLSAGRCILLLDAFDEMGVAAAGRSVEEQFRELARLAGDEPLEPRRGNRVLVTCRTHFFRDQQQVKDTAAGRPGGLAASEDSALGRLARRFNAEIDELCLFDDRQIAEFLEKHLPAADAARAREFIRVTYDLPTLAPRPVLLEMIVQSLPRLWREGAGQITPAGLYEVYTRQWLEDRSGRHLQTSPLLRHRLLTLLAAVLWRRSDRQIHHRELLDEVRNLAGLFPGLDHDRVDVELRTAAFLVRSTEGHYRFSHKSFLEYFLARGLWERLGADGEEAALALDLPPLSLEVGDFFWQLPDGGWQERLAILRQILRSPHRSGIGENALRLGLWSRTATGEPFAVEGARLCGAHLDGEDLREVRLPGADLSAAALSEVDLARANLAGSRLDGATLRGARAAGIDLTEASLGKASLVRADLRQAHLGGADLKGADLRAATLDGADLSAACLREADLRGAAGDATSLVGADLRQARLERSVWSRPRFRGARLDGAATAEWLVAEEDQALPRVQPAGRLRGLETRVGFAWGHQSRISSLAWSADGALLSSGSMDGRVLVWDGQTGELLTELTGLGGGVWSVAWAPSGRNLAAGTEDGTVRIWDGETGALVQELPGTGSSVRAVAWSPSGLVLAAGALVGAVQLWDMRSGDRIRELTGSVKGIRSLSWSLTGSELAAGSAGGSVRVWDTRTGELLRELAGSEHAVWSLARSSSGRERVAVGDGAKVRVWDGATGDPQWESAGSGSLVTSLAWSPSGRELAAGSPAGSVRVWNGKSGELLSELPTQVGGVWSLSWSPSGCELAVGAGDGRLQVWDGQKGAFRWGVEASSTGLWSVAWSPSGQELATGGPSGTALWARQTGDLVWASEGSQGIGWSVAWSPTGRELASATSDGVVQVWDGKTRELLKSLGGPFAVLFSVAWSLSGRKVVAGDLNGPVRIWDRQTGVLLLELAGTGPGVLSLASSPSGQQLAAGLKDGIVQVWEVQTAELVRELEHPGGRPWSLSWSPSGGELAVGSEDGIVRVWDAQTGSLLRELAGSGGGVWSVSWSPSGGELAGGCSDKIVRVWDRCTGELVQKLAGEGGNVWSVAWSPSGRELAAGSSNGTVEIWDRQTGELRATFQAWERQGLAAVPGGWFHHSPSSNSLDPRRFRLLVADPQPGPARGWRVLPLGGLSRYLESPERVRAALAGERQPPAILPGPEAPTDASPKNPSRPQPRRRRGS